MKYHFDFLPTKFELATRKGRTIIFLQGGLPFFGLADNFFEE